MLFPYRGESDPLLWNIETADGIYAFLPQHDRPGGVVVFRSEAAAERFLRYHAVRWRPLPEARVRAMQKSLSEALADWLIELQNVAAPEDILVVFIDPRPPIIPSHDIDADVLCLRIL